MNCCDELWVIAGVLRSSLREGHFCYDITPIFV